MSYQLKVSAAWARKLSTQQLNKGGVRMMTDILRMPAKTRQSKPAHYATAAASNKPETPNGKSPTATDESPTRASANTKTDSTQTPPATSNEPHARQAHAPKPTSTCKDTT